MKATHDHQKNESSKHFLFRKRQNVLVDTMRPSSPQKPNKTTVEIIKGLHFLAILIQNGSKTVKNMALWKIKVDLGNLQ